jgi:hypothetical protein
MDKSVLPTGPVTGERGAWSSPGHGSIDSPRVQSGQNTATQGDDVMVMQLFTCPHCAAGFATQAAIDAHGREAHRDVTPKQHDLEQKVYPDADFKERAERDHQTEENRKKRN